jgi:hypothetical protein
MRVIKTHLDYLDFCAHTLKTTQWHEPDQQEVSIRTEIIGNHVDNATGSWPEDDGDKTKGEYKLIFSKDGEEMGILNLALLLEWACVPEADMGDIVP